MLYSKDVKKSISDIMPEISSKYKVKSLYLFGSYARGDQKEQSDIDILVDFENTPDLLSFIELEEFLSERLKHKVDLVPKRKLKSRIKDRILREAIEL